MKTSGPRASSTDRQRESTEEESWPPEVVELPIDGVLDLHTFSPKEIKQLVPDYLEECRARGLTAVRIIHGKGTGTLRRIVHAILDRTPFVIGYRLAGPQSGGWGATEIDLAPIDESSP